MKIPSFLIKSSKEVLSSKSGLILFGEFCHKIRLPQMIKEQLPAAKSNRGYSPENFVIALILMLHAGGRYLEDTKAIARDQGLCKLMNLEQIPSVDAIGDWLRRMGEDSDNNGLNIINKKIAALTLSSVKTQHLTLDIDATVIAANKYAASYTYKGCKGYTPLLGHIAENGAIINQEFRDGNVPPCAGNLEFIKQCCEWLPSTKRIAKLRADAASYQRAIFEYCAANNMEYAIGGKMSEELRSTIKRCSENYWVDYIDRFDVKTDSQITTIPWFMQNSNHPFTMIVKRTLIKNPDLFDEDKYSYHIVASNIDDDPQKILHWYNQRGEYSENRLKELKIGFSQEYMPCGTLEANAVYFSVATLAYNLFILLKREVLPKDWLNCQIQTIRLHLYNLPSKIVKASRQLIMQVPEVFYSLLHNIKQHIRCFVGTT